PCCQMHHEQVVEEQLERRETTSRVKGEHPTDRHPCGQHPQEGYRSRADAGDLVIIGDAVGTEYVECPKAPLSVVLVSFIRQWLQHRANPRPRIGELEGIHPRHLLSSDHLVLSSSEDSSLVAARAAAAVEGSLDSRSIFDPTRRTDS
ncbi:hypothetical protein PMAYCL1PPCAC_05611, partial [Pristionchus mayeri]